MKIRTGLLTLLLGVGIVSAKADSNDIVRIDIPLRQDAKYPFIRYRVLPSGFAYHVRETGHAHQNSASKQLTPEEFEKLIEALQTLPSSHVTTNAIVWVSVTMYRGNETEEMLYPRDQLPSALNTVIQLIGGIRPELESIVTFRLEPGAAGDATKPPRP